MDRNSLLGIAGGLTVLIVICSFILLNQPDFDHQLIIQVDNGVSADELTSQIDKENYYLQLKAKKRLNSIVLDKKNWGNGDLDPPDSYGSYVNDYKSDMNAIKEYKDIQIKFAKREITKEKFLSSTKQLKGYLSIRNLL